MTDEKRAVVVPFRTPGRPGRRRTSSRTVPQSWISRFWQLVDDDSDVNAEWDLLITRAVQAWCWRDPGSIRAVENCLASLKAAVERDWS